MNRSKWYQGFPNEEVETVSPKNKEEMQSLAADMKIASDELRAYLKNRPLKWRRKYSRNFSKWRKEANRSGVSEVCYEDGACEGFPEKTRIFAMHAFSLCLRITKINGELKIVNIYISFNED